VFHSATRLPHLLSPEQYCSRQYFEVEQQCVFQQGWHLVGAASELAENGSFLTCTLVGKPIQIRNFSGQLSALSNVCAHRHALISSAKSGRSDRMRCQYHAWEYHADGTTGKIPQPKNFVPACRDEWRIPAYQVETLGQLVFVSLASNPIPLRDFLGHQVASMIGKRFGAGWKLGLRWRPGYAVNWKIPVENSLESYHVPAVHSATFRVDPGASRTEHELTGNHTSMSTDLPFAPHSRIDSLFQSVESKFVRFLGIAPTNRYEQHHVFPNLLFSFTDAISLVQAVMPTAPQASVATILQFGRMPASGAAFKKPIASFWNRLKSAITRRILLEDLALFDSIQRGLAASPQRGVLGICEERIHRFQLFLQQACRNESQAD
jgi:phenylpropionate dioxygenase-like ring-hydroxylating dioxygenase large terminal subunit